MKDELVLEKLIQNMLGSYWRRVGAFQETMYYKIVRYDGENGHVVILIAGGELKYISVKEVLLSEPISKLTGLLKVGE